jgi:hypothetical protein
MPACIQQYHSFAVFLLLLSRGLYRCSRFAVVNEELHTSPEKNSHACFASVAPGSPQALFSICAVHTNSNAVVQSNDLQGEAEGGKDTDGEETSAVGAGHVQSRCGAGSGGGRGGRA